MAFRLDSTRLLRQCDRFLRALAYHIQGAPLPPGYETITAHPQDPSLEGVRDLLESQLRFQPYHTVGNDAFRYRYRNYAPDLPNCFVFELVFYDSLYVVGQISEKAKSRFQIRRAKRRNARPCRKKKS